MNKVVCGKDADDLSRRLYTYVPDNTKKPIAEALKNNGYPSQHVT